MRKTIFSLLIGVYFLTNATGSFGSVYSNDWLKDKTEDKDGKKSTAQPDVPGALVIEVANNILTNAPETMGLKQWASWTVNIYYMYEFPFGESAFSFNPGFGLGLESYRFDQNYTLQTVNDDFNTVITPLATILPNVDKYQLSEWGQYFFDIPFEIRWYADRDFKRKSFKIALGGKIGFRIDSKTKITYYEFDNKKKQKQKQNFNFNSPRYGAYARVGFGAISLYYYYSITEVFRNKRGPDETRAKTMMVGFSISGF